MYICYMMSLTWKHFSYYVGQVPDYGDHFFLSQILIGHVRCVISGKQNKL